ncbi:histidine phosphatase family protein [Cochlodiniinecator piscidefendens]|uniref:histidine phosphatase family protein n=1 Tax=Cochlodiniinecator piscidefendens TaxID=2715756 RepID=UPI00140AA1BB|nr:histidine phosphatase family protein [Cochlodiniinecator piscidefendens]
MQLPELFMLRHGQTIWNAEGRFQGQMNSDLTEQGKRDAARQGSLLSPVFKKFPNAKIVASPLGRVQQTATIALTMHNRTPEFDKNLMEISAGQWEGVTRRDIEKGWPDLFNASQTTIDLFMAAPGGEGYETLYNRCKAFLSNLDQPSIVFTHGTTMAVLRGIARNLSYEQVTQLDHRQGCIYHISDEHETILD